MPQTILITMTGQLPYPPYQAVFWNVYGEPDNTGAQSGYAANYLINIGVDSVTQSGAAVDPITLEVGGDLSGNLPDPYVSGLQGNPIASTDPTSGQYLIWSGTAWTPTTVSIPSTNVGGDLSGTLPNPTVVRLQTIPVDATTPTTNQILAYNGSRWIATSPAVPITTTATSAATPETLALRNSAGQASFATSLLGSATYGGNIIIDETTNYFSISQTGRTTNAATNDILIATQAPFASATLTNRLPGDFVLEIAPAVGALATTNSGNILFNFDGNTTFQFYQDPATLAGILEFPNTARLAEVTAIQSSTTMEIAAATNLNLSGTPIELLSAGNISLLGDGVIYLTSQSGMVFEDGVGSSISFISNSLQLEIDGNGIGFFGTTPVAKPTVTGSKGANAALASLMTALSDLGLLTDSTS